MGRSNLSMLKFVCSLSIISLLIIVTTLPVMISTRYHVMDNSAIQDFDMSHVREKQQLQRHILLQPASTAIILALPANQHLNTSKSTTPSLITKPSAQPVKSDKNNHTVFTHSANKSKPIEVLSTSSIMTCSDWWCSAHISTHQKHFYKSCASMAVHQWGQSLSDVPHRCRFMDAKDRGPVALVSVPGSGNTWTRGLLEKATGICTGSIYCDVPLRSKGFVGEYVHDGSVLVVKTHTSDFQWRGAKLIKRYHDDAFYDSAIFLIRNPFDTFVAERHRLKTLAMKPSRARQGDQSHITEVGKEEFGDNQEWEEYVHGIGDRWKKTVLMWYGSAQRLGYPILVLRYEDLKRDSLTQVLRMLDFLNVHYDRTEIKTRLQDDFNAVRRNHTCDFEHYTEDQKAYVRNMVSSTITELKSMGVDYEDLKLEEYLS